MSGKISIAFVITLLLIITVGCSKKKGCTDVVSINYDSEAEKDDGSCVYGGDGGNCNIILYPTSQGRPVYSKHAYLDSAYVKYNAIEAPGGRPPGGDPTLYDKIFTGNVGDTLVKITGLKKGKYFVYLTGVDSLNLFNKRVSWGIILIIPENNYEYNRSVVLNQICCVF